MIDWITDVTSALYLNHGVRRATKFVNDRMTVKATRHRRHDARSSTETFIVTFGRPNFIERRRIAHEKKKGIIPKWDRPVLTYWPQKKRPKNKRKK